MIENQNCGYTQLRKVFLFILLAMKIATSGGNENY